MPIKVVPEGMPGGSVVAVKRVNELGFYNLGLNQLALKVKLTPPRTLAVVRYLQLQSDEQYFKELRIGGTTFKRYSQRALERIREELPTLDMDEVWERYRPGATGYRISSV